MKLFCSLIFVFCLPLFSLAQKPLPYIVTSQDFVGKYGAFNVNEIGCDKHGYLYFTTNTGVYKFDGYEMSLVPGDGPLKSFKEIHEDYFGDLWFSGHFSIAKLQGDSLLEFPMPDTLITLAEHGYEFVYYDRNHLLHIAPKGQGHYVVDGEGDFKLVTGKSDSLNAFVVRELADGQMFHYSIFGSETAAISVHYQSKEGKLDLLSETNDNGEIHTSSLVTHADGSVTLSIGTNLLLQIDNEGLVDTIHFPNLINNIFKSENNDLWISTPYNGVFQLKNGNYEAIRHFPSKIALTTVYAQSHDGTIWMKTGNSGFSGIPFNNFDSYSAQNNFQQLDKARDIYPIGDSLLIANRGNDISLLYNDKIIPIPFPDKTYQSYTNHPEAQYSSFCYNPLTKIFYFCFTDIVLCWDGQTWTTIDLKDFDLGGQRINRIKVIGDRVVASTTYVLFEIVGNKIIVMSEAGELLYRDYEINTEGQIYIGQRMQISEFENGQLKPLNSELIEETVLLMFQKKETIGIVTIEEGNMYRLRNDVISPTFDQNGNPLQVWSCSVDEDSVLWAITRELDLVKITDFENETVQVEYFEIPQFVAAGLTPYSLLVKNHKIHIAAYNGLFVKRIKDLEPLLPKAKMNIKTQINGGEASYETQLDLLYNQNNFYFDFNAVGFNLWTVSYRYQLLGYDTTWTEATHTQVQYTNLPPGDYKFELQSKISYGDWSDSQVVTIQIAKPYWETWWFRIAVLLVVLLIMYGFIKLRISNVKKKERKKAAMRLELVQLEMKALKAQINPHFIFNSITSVMIYLANNDTKKASSYLQRFSKVIRKVLESSNENKVLLKDELQLLTDYISLESEQFEGDPIKLKANYEGVKEDQIMLPPTILQPYIENSIQHGLKSKRENKLIELNFKKQGEKLKIEIVDNGIGRVAARKLDTRSGHKSLGMLISTKRIEILSQNKISSVEVIDLYDTDKKSLGTKISFFIPIQYVNLKVS